MRSSVKRLLAVTAAAAAVLGISGAIYAAGDFGSFVEQQLGNRAGQLFGVADPLSKSSAISITPAQAEADPASLATLAKPLKAKVVTSSAQAGANVDMMALWPNDPKPTHLIACNEQGAALPGLQRINIATGEVATILTGTVACDPAQRTPWGTILFAEEAGGGPNGGRVYELLDPLNTTGVTLDRVAGTFSGGTGAANFAVRPALGRLSYEGLAVYPNGLVYYGDENRPNVGNVGGAYFKFIPATLRNPADPPIGSLDQSPLKAGSVYGLRLGKRSGSTDYGQGTQTGFGTWVPIPPAADPDLRAQAVLLKLTGYYRPEDLEPDRMAEAAGMVKACGNNTGNEADDQNYGEAICLTDGTLAAAAANLATPEVQMYVVGNPALAMMDNIAQQPKTGNWIIQEDGDTDHVTPHNNDLWDCLPDGDDADLLSDGCVRIGTLNDLGAEWTGGIFDSTGKRFFVSVQHNMTGHGVVLEITGWRVDGNGGGDDKGDKGDKDDD